MRSHRMLLGLVFGLGCGGASSPAAAPPMTSPPAAPEPAVDPRCTAPQAWFQPGCGSEDVFAQGCFTSCAKPGATSEERIDPAACGAGFTCTQVMISPTAAIERGAASCGTEAHLCLPGTP